MIDISKQPFNASSIGFQNWIGDNMPDVGGVYSAYSNAVNGGNNAFNFAFSSAKSPLDWINPISTAISAGQGIIGGITNYFNQKQNLEYQKNLQQQIFEREDTAVQRRMADMRKAGINPVLAYGGSANSGAVVNTSAPQYNPYEIGKMSFYDDTMAKMNVLSSLLGLQAQKADIQARKEDIRLKKQLYNYNQGRLPAWLNSIIGGVSGMFKFSHKY